MSQADHVYTTDHTELQRLRAIRKDIEASLERMLTILDTLDGDPDLEDDELEDGGDDEPALGWSGVSQLALTAQEDGETSLGWANEGSQARLHAEPSGDECEPSLGSVGSCWGQGGQTGWAMGARDDREEENEHGGNIEDEPHDDDDPAEEDDTGIGDADGLEEQAGMRLDYDVSEANRAAAHEALAELRRKAGVGAIRDGICNVTLIEPGGQTYHWWRP